VDWDCVIRAGKNLRPAFVASTTIWFTGREFILSKTMMRSLNGTWRRALRVLPLELK
jgi:hypothetical protein